MTNEDGSVTAARGVRPQSEARSWTAAAVALAAWLVALLPGAAQASMFKGETLDKVADVLAIVVLIIVPVIGIAVFWLVHILPEKIAEKRHHPQAKAISDALPALARVRRAALADRLALGLHQAGALQDGLRDRHRRSPRGRGARQGRGEGDRLMEVLLLGIYSFFVWLIFIKFKWLPWNIISQVTVAVIPIVALTSLILYLNVVAPSSADVRVIKKVVQILPQVRGRVIEVPRRGTVH